MKKILSLVVFTTALILVSSCGSKKNDGIKLWVVENGDTVVVSKPVTAADFNLEEGYSIAVGSSFVSMRADSIDAEIDFDLANISVLLGVENMKEIKDNLLHFSQPQPGVGFIIDDPNHADYYIAYLKPSSLDRNPAYGFSAPKTTIEMVAEQCKDEPEYQGCSPEQLRIIVCYASVQAKYAQSYIQFINFTSQSGINTRAAVVGELQAQ